MIIIIIIIITIIIYTHLLKPYPIKKRHSTTNKGEQAKQRKGRHVQEESKAAHTLKQKSSKRKTPQCSQQRRPKGAKGREMHALQKQQQQQQLGTDKN